MRRKIQRETMQPELAVAIGLVWGHMQACQYEEAYKLARGCLRIWPQEHRLILMQAYASVEILEPLAPAMMAALDKAACTEWAERIKLRHAATESTIQATMNEGVAP
jgi:hypothetical protein